MSQSQKDIAGMITVIWVPGVVGCRQEGEWWLLGAGGDRQRESVGAHFHFGEDEKLLEMGTVVVVAQQCKRAECH